MRHKIHGLVAGLMLAAAANTAHALDLHEDCRAAVQLVEKLTNEAGATTTIEGSLGAHIAKLAKPTWAPGYCRAVADNLASKAASLSEGVSFSTQSLISTAVEFEAFRITAFRNSGVAPKRYFGFLDERGKAAAYETKLKTVATRIAPILNAYSEKKKLGVTVTPKEIVITHIAEGAALLLSTDYYLVDNIHPVSGVGLDDYRHGFKQYADLVSEIDTTFKSRLAAIADNPERPRTNSVIGGGTVHRLERYLGVVSMTFEESILGTAVMYLWEKVIAEEKRRADGRPSLATLTLDEQYVQASLVYNSGILFADERARQVMAFDTAAYLFETSEKSAPKRPKLPVLTPEAADALLERGGALPNQPTSWNAIYHILQRYGAWVALTRFTNVFTTDGEIQAVK
ncbi:MAG: hypothetical protein ABL904_04440 [Hyphomicrobiaceae bacterium]